MLRIAEVKTMSPFGYRSTRTWDELFQIANEVGDMLSIHDTHPWGGSLDLLRKARSLTDKQILAKGVHSEEADVVNALGAGADVVLSLGLGMLASDYLDVCFIEPYNLDELQRIPRG